MGRGVAESRDCNSVREYASTRVHDVPTYQHTKPFTIELGIILKGPLSLPR